MENIILENEKWIRLICFIGIFMVVAIAEVVVPRRKKTVSKSKRWVNNLGLTFLNTYVLRLLFPGAAVAMAAFVSKNQWGLLNHYQIEPWVAVIISIVFMDLVIYLQHVMVHAVPLFWRLHKVHHVDLDYDVTTGARFHPIEIILSLFIKFATIAVIGAPIAGVILFEVILNGMAMFNHGNFRIPIKIDRVLRTLLVTPDVHRIHHSILEYETNSNFGFNLSIWDRLFGTFKEEPELGHLAMTIGTKNYRSEKETVGILAMILMPFKKMKSGYVINSRKWK